jgi:hypothetical protein
MQPRQSKTSSRRIDSLTRRAWAKLAAAAILPATLGSAAGPDGLSSSRDGDASFHPGLNLERRYRVDAQVLLFSVPLLRRAAVGAGNIAWREGAAPGGPIRLLEFAAWSIPGRAAGLNRLGFIRERIRLGETGMAEAVYFGLMTVSGEENAADARGALHSSAEETMYSAVDAHVGGESMDTATARFPAPAALSVSHRVELERMARVALSGAPRKTLDFRPGDPPPPPFLHAMAELLGRPDGAEGRYVYNGGMYHLHLRRAHDAKAGEYFRSRGLAAGDVIQVDGVLRRVNGGSPIEFRVWVEKADPHPLPLRIAYQPKSYLRLVIEAEAQRSLS